MIGVRGESVKYYRPQWIIILNQLCHVNKYININFFNPLKNIKYNI